MCSQDEENSKVYVVQQQYIKGVPHGLVDSKKLLCQYYTYNTFPFLSIIFQGKVEKINKYFSSGGVGLYIFSHSNSFLKSSELIFLHDAEKLELNLLSFPTSM